MFMQLVAILNESVNPSSLVRPGGFPRETRLMFITSPKFYSSYFNFRLEELIANSSLCHGLGFKKFQ